MLQGTIDTGEKRLGHGELSPRQGDHRRKEQKSDLYCKAGVKAALALEGITSLTG
jgi:hypothetical protein